MHTHYDVIKSSEHVLSLEQRASHHITKVISFLYFIHRMLTGGAIVPKIAAKSSQKYTKNALTLNPLSSINTLKERAWSN